MNWLSHGHVCKICGQKEDPGSRSYANHHLVPNLPQSWYSWHLTGSLRVSAVGLDVNQTTGTILY